MTYAIMLKTDFRTEIKMDIRGTRENEVFTNSRIMRIYPKGKRIKMTVGDFEFYATVKNIIKVYENSEAEYLV